MEKIINLYYYLIYYNDPGENRTQHYVLERDVS